MKKVRKFIKQLIDLMLRPYMRILPGQLAFFILMSLIPLLALFGSLADYFSLSIDSIARKTSIVLPVDLSILFSSNGLVGGGLNFNIIIFFISAFLLASNGMHSVIITVNEIYGYKDEGTVLRRIKSVSMTVIIVALLFFLFIIGVFGNTFFELLKDITNIDIKTIEFMNSLFNFLKIPVLMLLLFFNIRGLFKLAPDNSSTRKTATYAALFTTVIWILGTEIYSVYVKFFSNYNLFYGSISNIIILMVWIYFLSYVFVLGIGLSTINIDKLFSDEK